MGLFRLVFICFATALGFYISHQLTRFSDFSFFETLILLILSLGSVALTAMMPLFFWTPRGRLWIKKHHHLQKICFSAMVLMSSLLALVVLRDVAGLLISWTEYKDWNLILYGRVSAGVVVLISFFILTWSSIQIQRGPKQFNIKVKLPSSLGDLDGLRIVHISDWHLTPSLDPNFFEKIIDWCNQQESDFIVLTGDIFDSTAESLKDRLPALQKLRAKKKIYFVLGNHEYYWGAQSLISLAQEAGFTVLLNSTDLIDFSGTLLSFSGLADPAARHFHEELPSLQKIQQESHHSSYRILLAHQPQIAPAAAAAGFHLQLSGHTHGGQFFPWNYLIYFAQRFRKGLYIIQEMILFVHQGTSYWGPAARFGTHSELVTLDLEIKPSQDKRLHMRQIPRSDSI